MHGAGVVMQQGVGVVRLKRRGLLSDGWCVNIAQVVSVTISMTCPDTVTLTLWAGVILMLGKCDQGFNLWQPL